MPCSCIGTPTIVVTPPCPSSNNCLKLANIIVACKDGVGPLDTGTIDVITSSGASYCHLTTGCGSTSINLSLVDFDKNIFSNVTLSGTTLQWTTKDIETIGKFGIISLKGCCGDLASKFYVYVCVKDLCKCVSLQTSETCDPYTGNAVPRTIDVSLQDSSTNIDVTIT